MDFTGLRSSHGRAQKMSTESPISTTPQNFASMVKYPPTSASAPMGTTRRQAPLNSFQ